METKAKMKAAVLGAVLVTALAASTPQDRPTFTQKPFPGFVPDEQTAIAVAKPVVRRLLGEDTTRYFEYKATLQKDEWKVIGQRKNHPREAEIGGTWNAELRIKKANGAMTFRLF